MQNAQFLVTLSQYFISVKHFVQTREYYKDALSFVIMFMSISRQSEDSNNADDAKDMEKLGGNVRHETNIN